VDSIIIRFFRKYYLSLPLRNKLIKIISMKKTLVLAFAGFCMFATLPQTFAQEDGNRDAQGKVVRGPYETNKFGANWFIDAGVGAGVYLGGHNRDFGSRITPAFQVGVGKWFTPSVGARVSFFYQNKAVENIGNTKYQFNYWDLHADFMWNLSNAFGGYKETRVYQCIPFVGAGYAQVVGANHFEGVGHAFSLDAGIINKFRVSNRIDLNLELRGAASTHMIDRIYSDRTVVDVPVAALAGVTIKLGKTNFQRVKDNSGEIAAAVESALAAKNAELAAANANNKKLASELEALQNQPKETVTKVCYGDIPADGVVFFELNKSELNKKEKAHLATFAYYVKQVIASGKDFTLIGSANKDRATAQQNMKLSQARVDNIKSQLVKKYGIDASKLKTKAEGDTNNIFGDSELDRCVYVKLK